MDKHETAAMVTALRREKIARTVDERQQGILIMEDIHDPHNAEAVFRSCDAFGIQHIYLIFEEEEPFNPSRVGRISSSSANKWLTFTTFHSTSECLEAVKKEGYEIVATVLSDRAHNIYEADLSAPRLALMLGNEHRGLTETAIAMADQHLIIPMRGMVQSLNVSVTAAICLFEISRQRVEKGVEHYLLPEEERVRLRSAFHIR